MYRTINPLPADIQAMSTTAWIDLMNNQFPGSKHFIHGLSLWIASSFLFL
jgi:hypothetical protein